MIDSVISEFYRLTKIIDSEGFDDKKLKQLGDHYHLSTNEVAHLVANHLLTKFHSQAHLTLPSKILHNEFRLLSHVYDQAVQAFFRKKDPYHFPALRALFSTYSYTESMQRTLVMEAQKQAEIVHEHLLTFPNWYGLEQSPAHAEVKEMINMIDSNQQLSYQKRDLRPLFFKMVAIFVEGEAWNWDRLSVDWVQSGGDNQKLERFKRCGLVGRDLVYPFSVIIRSSSTHSPVSFQIFVIQKTIEEFEKELDLTLDEETKAQLSNQCLDENFRMNLIFFIQNRKSLQPQNIPCNSADHWIIGIQKFMKMNDHWEIDSQRRPVAFRWCLKAPVPVQVPIPTSQQPFPVYAISVSSIGKVFFGDDKWEEEALAILDAIKEHPGPQLLRDLERFLAHPWNCLARVAVIPFCKFLKEGGMQFDRQEKASMLSQFLKGVSARGCSKSPSPDILPLYFTLVYENWDVQDIEEAGRIIPPSLSVDRALQTLQNVAIKNRIQDFVGAPLLSKIAEGFLESSSRKDGVIASLDELFQLRNGISKREEILERISRIEELDNQTREFLASGIPPFEAALLESSSFLSYGFKESFERVAWSRWTHANGLFHFHFCIGRSQDGMFVYKKVTYEGKGRDLLTDSFFLANLVAYCKQPALLQNLPDSLEKDAIYHFLIDLEHANREAIQELASGEYLPYFSVHSSEGFPEEISDLQGPVNCQYEQDPFRVILSAGGDAFGLQVPPPLFSPQTLRWQLYLFRQT